MVEIIVCALTCLVLLAATAPLYAAFRDIHRARDNVAATVGRHQFPATSSSSPTDLAPCRSRSLSQTNPSVKRVTREPNVFHGNPSEFKEWVFTVELALKCSPQGDPESQVNFAASYLAGNARLWLISSMEAGQQFSDWHSLKSALARVYGPHYDGERVRLDMFSIQQRGSIESYVTEFSRLSLQVPELDELSRALLFVNGLHGNMRTLVVKEHPTTLSAAIQAALAVASDSRFQRRPPLTTAPGFAPPSGSRKLTKLNPEERETLRAQGAASHVVDQAIWPRIARSIEITQTVDVSKADAITDASRKGITCV